MKVKAKPILFSTPMVQAILDGHKTQTRRVIKVMDGYNFVEFERDPICVDERRKSGERIMEGTYAIFENRENDLYAVKCHYAPGELLWVREAWAKISDWTDVDPAVGIDDGYIYKAEWEGLEHPKWRPSIHMPRSAARIFLEVNTVRVERVKNITPDDCLAEGMFAPYVASESGYRFEMVAQYRELWDSLNAKRGYGWHADPWVWVYEFERISEGAQH